MKPPTGSRELERLFAGPGEMAARMRATNWAVTPLGPVESWPQCLRTMVGVVLGSRFPMLLSWGPELLQLYNDAYRPILRDKHPASFLAPAAEVWADALEIVAPRVRGVILGGGATWAEDVQVFIRNGDMAEEAYFTTSSSPVPGADGRLAGVLSTVQETTEKVLLERQLRMLAALGEVGVTASSEAEVYREVLAVLSQYERDFPFSMMFAVADSGAEAVSILGFGWGAAGTAPGPARVVLRGPPGPDPWNLVGASDAGRLGLLVSLPVELGPPPEGRWGGTPSRAIVVALRRVGEPAPYAFLVLGVSPHRAMDEAYRRLYGELGDRVAGLVASARERQVEAGRVAALAELDRLKSTFFNNVSHELRTPLTLVLGPLRDALATPERSLSGEALEAAFRNAQRLLRLTNTLLDVSRIGAGHAHARFEATDLDQFTEGLASGFRSMIEAAGLGLVVDCPPLMEAVWVDRTMWETVVLNLLSNAFKHTFEGTISVSLRVSGAEAVLRVADTGVGIAPEHLPGVFERFSRVEGARSRSREGSGLGLALVRELVWLHGGRVEAQSHPDRGSVFVVCLPRGKAHLPAEQLVASRPLPAPASPERFVDEASGWDLSSAEAAEAPARDPAARVLVADGNADMRRYLRRLLSPQWTVDTAADGERALARVQVSPPDLVIADATMPGMGGLGLLKALRAQPATRAIPVVLLSARAGDDARLEGLDAGADEFLVKPFIADELLLRVRTQITQAQVRQERERAAVALTAELERQLAGHALELSHRSRDLTAVNQELSMFTYTVAHDLRAPLRAIHRYADLLLDDHPELRGTTGEAYAQWITTAAQRMDTLILSLLAYARVSRTELRTQAVLLEPAVGEAALLGQERAPSGSISVVGALPAVLADPGLVREVLRNLVVNAFTYVPSGQAPRVRVGAQCRPGVVRVWVQDNGVGIAPEHHTQIFGLFERVHASTAFAGVGIGLAIVKRAVERMGGTVGVDSEVGAGSTFWFELPEARR